MMACGRDKSAMEVAEVEVEAVIVTDYSGRWSVVGLKRVSGGGDQTHAGRVRSSEKCQEASRAKDSTSTFFCNVGMATRASEQGMTRMHSSFMILLSRKVT
ncbi:hypothetical protein E2C01_099372 [Portunus trituberculatus]|uniref:Uncharacterized protein n=1 Tax=Portunus trituberculatus TaxID=210409 RepID=A0A5B7K071_PORTR|nr:hypothetical protein [Portunus trituberculatus]